MGKKMQVRIDGDWRVPLSTLLFNILEIRACTRSSRGSGGGDKGRRKRDQGTEVCR